MQVSREFKSTQGLGHRFMESERAWSCRNADAKAKVKKAKQAMRALGGKSGGPLESPEDNMRLKQGVRRSISDAQQELQKRQRTTLAGAPGRMGRGVKPRSQLWLKCRHTIWRRVKGGGVKLAMDISSCQFNAGQLDSVPAHRTREANRTCNLICCLELHVRNEDRA